MYISVAHSMSASLYCYKPFVMTMFGQIQNLASRIVSLSQIATRKLHLFHLVKGTLAEMYNV